MRAFISVVRTGNSVSGKNIQNGFRLWGHIVLLSHLLLSSCLFSAAIVVHPARTGASTRGAGGGAYGAERGVSEEMGRTLHKPVPGVFMTVRNIVSSCNRNKCMGSFFCNFRHIVVDLYIVVKWKEEVGFLSFYVGTTGQILICVSEGVK